MPVEMKEKQKEKAIKQALKLLTSEGIIPSTVASSVIT
jgi:mannitol/fructose-specific phosphotransferase system IIA component